MTLGELVSLLTGYAHCHRAELRILPISRHTEFPQGWRVLIDNPNAHRSVSSDAATLREACLEVARELDLTGDA